MSQKFDIQLILFARKMHLANLATKAIFCFALLAFPSLTVVAQPPGQAKMLADGQVEFEAALVLFNQASVASLNAETRSLPIT